MRANCKRLGLNVNPNDLEKWKVCAQLQNRSLNNLVEYVMNLYCTAQGIQMNNNEPAVNPAPDPQE